MANELRNLLKSQDLDTVKPTSFKQVGGVVFPDEGTAQDLQDFNQVVDSFKAVHLPTNGAVCIPGTTLTTTVTMTDSQTNKTLLTGESNTVREIVSIWVDSDKYDFGGGYLAMKGNPVMDLSNIDDYTNSFSGLIFGNMLYANQSKTPAPMRLNGGDSLALYVKNPPNQSLSINVMYRNIMQ